MAQPAAADVTRADRRAPAAAPRAWPLRLYFGLLLLLFAAVAGTTAVYVSVQAGRDARAAAGRDAAYAAGIAARQLGAGIAQLQTSVDGVAASLKTQAIPRRLTTSCSLAFGGSDGLERGHIDILRPDGVTVCSSRARPGDRSLPGYRGEPWLARAASGPLVLAPATDAATGGRGLLTTAPIARRGLVAAFVDLQGAARSLAGLYGGGQPVEFLVTTPDGRTVISRSIAPSRWAGARLPGGGYAPGSSLDRRDLDGRDRIYRATTVPGVGWRFLAGIDRSAALADGSRLRNRQLAIIAGGFLLLLLATVAIYRRVALPITRLRLAVAGADPYAEPVAPIAVRGPAEVNGLTGDINGLLASVGHELQERRRAEETARASEESYRLLFDNSPLAMCLCDAGSGRIRELNAAAARHHGRERDDLLGRSLLDLVAARDRGTLARILAADGPAERLGPLHQRRADGTELEVRVTSHAVPFAGDDARLVLLEDVGERERFERQLRQSQRLESLGQLAGGIAHDFNNLLGVILGFAGLARERAPDAELERNLGQIERAAERGAALVGQLLAFARRDVVAATVLDLDAVLADLEPILERAVGDGVALELDPAGELWSVLLDRGQVEQVLINLAVNARDAMGGEGRLTIDTANVDVDEHYAASRPGVPTGRYVRLRVSDTGEGMDEATAQRAFEPFFTTKPPGSGSGLGLATVYGIVTQASGRVALYSEPGRGTTVTILLPVAPDSVGPARGDAATGVSEPGRGERVLVVEDEPALRELTARMLRRNGYEVLVAADGAEGVAAAAAQPHGVDVLVTDVVMPRMLGREVAERVAEIHPGVRVLYISGYAQPVLGSAGTLEPGVELLEKPFSEPALLGRLRQILDAPDA